MARPKKCACCKTILDQNSPPKIFDNKNYCLDCFNKKMTCPICGKKHQDLKVTTKYKGYLYCITCYKTMMSESSEKTVIEENKTEENIIEHANINSTPVKLTAVEKEKLNYKKLMEYIFQIYDFKSKNNKNGRDMPKSIFTQLKYFHDKLDCKYEGMLLTLQYYYEILKESLPEPPSLWFIPLYYDEAKKVSIISKSNVAYMENKTDEDVQDIIVTIKKSEKEEYNDTFENRWRLPENMVDISEIEVDEDDDDE